MLTFLNRQTYFRENCQHHPFLTSCLSFLQVKLKKIGFHFNKLYNLYNYKQVSIIYVLYSMLFVYFGMLN